MASTHPESPLPPAAEPAAAWGGTALVAALALLVAEIVRVWNILPDRVATHFDLAGQANDWSDKSGFLTFYLLLSVAIAALFASMRWLLPRIPDRLINMPAKDYWLAPERRAATLRRTGNSMLWMGAATVGLLLAMLHLTARANLGEPPVELSPHSWIPVAAYLVAIAAFTVAMLRSFRRPRDA